MSSLKNRNTARTLVFFPSRPEMNNECSVVVVVVFKLYCPTALGRKLGGILWSMLSFQCAKENGSKGEALAASKVEKRQTRGKSCNLKVWSLKFLVVPSQSCSKANLEPRFQSWFVNIGSCQRRQRLGTSHFSFLRENLSGRYRDTWLHHQTA